MDRATVAVADFFFYGPLCHPPLLEAVVGRPVAMTPATLADHAAFWAAGQVFAVIRAEAGATTAGVVVAGLTVEEVARVEYYAQGFALGTGEVTLAGRARPVRVFVGPAGGQVGAPWSLNDWVASHGAVVIATARDVMSLRDQCPAARVAARYPSLLVRGASRLRAAAPTAPGVRRPPAPGDVTVAARRAPYAHFFAVEEYDLRHRRFDGTPGRVLERAVFVSADAATVLPYDPVRDRVMVIEQFRMGPFARGDANPWQVEAIAGRVDPFETPQDAARREAAEEAGLTLAALHPVAGYYPSPGAKTEFLYSYVGIADLPDAAAGVGGLEAEGEDIRAHILPFHDLMAMIARGEGANGPLILSAYWLAANRERLRTGR